MIDEGLEEVGDGVVAETTLFVALEKPAGLKFLKVGTGGVVGDGVPVLMFLEGVMVLGMAKGMIEKVELAGVKFILKSLAPAFRLGVFIFYEGVEVVQAADKDAKVDEHTVGGVEMAGLHIEVGLVVGGAFLAEHAGNGDVGGDPVAVAEEAPVEEGAGSTAIAVPEGVFVSEERMEKDGLEDGMKEGGACLGVLVGKGDEGGHAGRQVGGRRRLVNDPIIAIADDNIVGGAIAALGGLREKAVGEGAVDAGEEVFCERFAAPNVKVADSSVVVGDHALAVVARGALVQEHLLGDLASGGGALHLAGGDGLGDLLTLKVSPPKVREVIATVCATEGDGYGGFAVDFVK